MEFHVTSSLKGALARGALGGMLGLALVSGVASSISAQRSSTAAGANNRTQVLQGTPIKGAVRSGEVNLATLPPATPAMIRAAAKASKSSKASNFALQTPAQQAAYRQWALSHPGALPKATGAPVSSSLGPKTYGNGAGPVLLSAHAGLSSTDPGGDPTASPNPVLAAAPGYLFEGANNVMEVYSATYAKKYGPWTPDQLFASVTHTDHFFDSPQITYDAERARYLIVWLERTPPTGTDVTGPDYLDIAISKTSTPSPLTNFLVYQYPMTNTGQSNMCVNETLGYDYWGAYITCDTIAFTNFTFVGNNTLAFSLNRMLDGTGLVGSWWDSVLTDVSCGTGCLKPAFYISPTIEDGVPQAEWITATDASYGGTRNFQDVCALTNTHALDAASSGAKPTFSCVITHLPALYDDPFPAPQLDGAGSLYPGYGYKQVAYRNGQLYFAMPEAVDCSGNTHDGIYWAAITPQLTTFAINTPQHANGVVDAYTQVGVLCASDRDLFLPTLIADTEGDITLTFNYSSSSMFPSIGFIGRTAADAPGVMGQGLGFGSVIMGTNDGVAWGNYSTCSLAPNLVTRGIVYCAGQFGDTNSMNGGWDTELYAIRMQ
jgi:hypothetical protein